MNRPQRILEDDLKAIVDIVKFIGRRVPLQLSGHSFKANCPFHQENTPSFYVFPDRQSWRCFGSCNAAGGVIDFMEKFYNLSHGEAVRSLAVEYALALPKATSEPETLDGRTCSLKTMSDSIAPDQSLFASGTRERKREIQAYVAKQRSGRELRLCSDGLWRPNYYYDDRQLIVGNLGYKGRINRFGRINGLKSLLPESRPVGIVVALPTTLQNHVEIERPDGQIRIEDASEVFNAGEITWVRGEAIVKDVTTNAHDTATLLGCSTMGFCLIEPPGSLPFWIGPKEPDEAGGRARPFGAYIHDVWGRSVRLLSLESFFIHDSIDGDIPDSYRDVSGIQVPIEVPKYSLKRHADRIKRGNRRGIGGE
jgi:hypothetical protein